jgi:di/tripeptidase
MENRKGVILQAHMDMVPQKNNARFTIEKDPIKPRIEGDRVYATELPLELTTERALRLPWPFWRRKT